MLYDFCVKYRCFFTYSFYSLLPYPLLTTLVGLVSIHDSGNESVTYDVFRAESYGGNASNVGQNVESSSQSASFLAGQVDLGEVARDDHFRVGTHSGEKHFNLRRGSILSFVEDDDGIA